MHSCRPDFPQPARPSIRLRRAGTGRAATPNALRLPGSRPLIGSRSESYDSSLAGTIIGVYNAELCYRHGPWPALTDVEFVLLQWVWLSNHPACSSPSASPHRPRYEDVCFLRLRTPPELETLKLADPIRWCYP